MADIVISEFMDGDAVRELSCDFDVIYDPTLVDRVSDLHRALAACRGLIVRNRTQVREDLLAASPNLRVVGRLGVGLDNIDVEACKFRRISVVPAIGAVEAPVAEFTIAAIFLLLRRRTFYCTPDVVAGKWPREEMIGLELAGRRLGLVAFGAIAREVAARAAVLGMQVSAYDPYVPAADGAWSRFGVEYREFDDLLSQSDIISVHTPLTPETRGLIDGKAFARMKAGAFLVNTARGGVVNEAAMVEALKTGRLAGAVVDVFDKEPLAAANPFKGVPNLHLTPHIAGYTEESSLRVGRIVAGGIRAALAGQ